MPNKALKQKYHKRVPNIFQSIYNVFAPVNDYFKCMIVQIP